MIINAKSQLLSLGGNNKVGNEMARMCLKLAERTLQLISKFTARGH